MHHCRGSTVDRHLHASDKVIGSVGGKIAYRANIRAETLPPRRRAKIESLNRTASC